jgi:hypothetical protein
MKTNRPCEALIKRIREETSEKNQATPWNLIDEAARLGCEEVKPYLLGYLAAEEPFSREMALRGLRKLGAKSERTKFIEAVRGDPDQDVRLTALVNLGELFRGEADNEVLELALDFYQDPNSDIGIRLVSGAVMMYQLGITHDEQGAPAWWDEDEPEWLEHPSIIEAVNQTKAILGRK